MSCFVASYATNSTQEFAEWVRQVAAFHIIDVMNLGASDFVASNNGRRRTFFDLPALARECAADGWTLYMNEATPDFNSGRQCAVVKIFGIREDLEVEFHIAGRLASRPELNALLPMRPLTESSAGECLESLRTSLTTSEWEALAEYKRAFPIWGRPIEPVSTLAEVDQLLRAPTGDLDLVFESGQVNHSVRHALGLE